MSTITCSNCFANNSPYNKYCSECGHTLPKTEAPVIPAQAEVQKKSWSKNKVNNWIAASAGMVFAGTVLTLFLMGVFSGQVGNAVLHSVSNEFNKQCPIMVDEVTRVDRSEVLPHNTIQYNCTVLGAFAEDFNPEEFTNEVKPNIIENLKSNPQMMVFNEVGATINYAYFDEQGSYIATISIKPEEYTFQ